MLIRPHCWLCLLTPSCGRIKRFVCESMTTRVGSAKGRPWVPLHQQIRPHLKCDITNSQLFTPSDIRTIADYIARSEQIGTSLSLSISQPPSGESSLIFRKLNFNKVFRQKVSCGHIVITIHHLITSSYHHIFISGAASRFLIIIISNMIRLSSSRYFIKHNTKIILCCYD